MVDVVAASSSLTVLGGPSSIKVDLDLGSPGIRGSQIFTGPGAPTDPAIQSTVFANDEPIVNDLFINLSPSSPDYLYLYKYENVNAVLQWSKILRLIPNAVIVNPAVKFINGIAHTVVNFSGNPVIIKGLYFPLSAFLETVDLGNLGVKDFNIQYNILGPADEELSTSLQLGKISPTHTVEVFNPITGTYATPQVFPFGVQTLSAFMGATIIAPAANTPLYGYRIVHFISTIGGRSTDILDFDGSAVNSTLNTITYTDHGLITGEIVAYMNNGNTSISGLNNESEYAVVVQDEDTIRLLTSGQSFTPSTAVNYSTNAISITSHGFTTGDVVIYQDNNNTPIGGLVDGFPYFVVVVNSSTIMLSADGVSPVDLTNAGSTGTHSLPKVVDFGPGATGQHSLVTFPSVGA